MGIKNPKEKGSAKYFLKWAFKFLKKKGLRNIILMGITNPKEKGQQNIYFNGD